jgi:putative ABC transport system substrate-binding protein
MSALTSRRDFLALVGGAATGPLAWPRGVRAQELPVIGFLNSGSPRVFAPQVQGFRAGLNEGGYVEGQNVTVEYRWAEGAYDRLPGLAAELVRRPVALIAATGGTVSALAAKAATSSIPVIFEAGGDPIRLGLVASLNRPGGNVTGVSNFFVPLVVKRVELIHELAPAIRKIAILSNPSNPTTESQIAVIRAAADALRLDIDVLHANDEPEIAVAFEAMVRRRVGALTVLADPLLANRRGQITALAARHGLPAIYSHRDFIVSGGLISYGTDLRDVFRQVGLYATKVLQGTPPSDLPVMQPRKFELIINLNAAKALGLAVPPTLLALADEVIE